jgi:hypothetical protein
MAETFKINGIDYECEFKLTNPDKQEVSFTKSAILDMTIIDNVFEPFLSGTIAIANPYDFLEKDYFIRGDGRDRLNIMFKPKESKDDKDKFEHTFALVEESTSGNKAVRSENIKIFSLLDESAIPFMDKLPYGKSYSGKVGEILYDIFVELLGEDQVDKDNWENGDFQLDYIPPLSFRYLDLMYYLLKLFYAKSDDIYVKGLINRDTEKNKYNFKLISKIFEEHKDNTIEAFVLGDLTSKLDTQNKNNPPPEAEIGTYVSMIHNIGYSTAMYNWTNDFFINSLVMGYDKILGEHKIRKLKFDDLKQKWQKKFVDVFKSVGGKPKPFVIQNNTTKEKFKIYRFPYPVEDSVKLVESEIHNHLIFYNLNCSFSIIGKTKRESGKFLDLFSTRGNNNFKSDEKLLGRWYITEVRHTFNMDLYDNQIFGAKTYIGPESTFKEDVD